MQDLIARKKQLRSRMRSLLEGLEAAQLASRSRRVQERLFATDWWARARWVFVYMAMAVEVDTTPIVVRACREGRQVAIPRIEGEQIAFYRYEGSTQGLISHPYGILEPDPRWQALDPLGLEEGPLLVLVPGLAFDRALRRIGRGKGYYDRFLARARSGPRECLAVGLTLAEQVVAEVPAGPADQRLDGLITDREVLGRPALP